MPIAHKDPNPIQKNGKIISSSLSSNNSLVLSSGLTKIDTVVPTGYRGMSVL